MKFLYKSRNRKTKTDFVITKEDIKLSKIVLFTIFGRYGDSIIGFAGSLEFIEKYPDKKYIFITSPQNYPYIYNKTKHLDNVKIFTLRKDNVFKLFYIISYLMLNRPDLGFNPFSWGEDSDFFITFSKKYIFFKLDKSFKNNYYKIVNNYLQIDFDDLNLNLLEVCTNNIKRILICPDSTEARRSLKDEHIKYFLKKYNNKDVILAVYKRRNFDIEQFIFSKKTSYKFLELVKKSDLIICGDSAPLHIAMLYDKNIIALFSSSSPSRVLNRNKKVKCIRNPKLHNILCEFKECKSADCLDFNYDENIYKLDDYFNKIIDKCPLEKENI